MRQTERDRQRERERERQTERDRRRDIGRERETERERERGRKSHLSTTPQTIEFRGAALGIGTAFRFVIAPKTAGYSGGVGDDDDGWAVDGQHALRSLAFVIVASSVA